MAKGSSNSRNQSWLPPRALLPFALTMVHLRPADSFLPFISPRAPAAGPPGEISLRQKKAMDILPGYTGSPGCGSLEGERAGTGGHILASLSHSSGPCQGSRWALSPQAQKRCTVWLAGEPCKAVFVRYSEVKLAVAGEQEGHSSLRPCVLRSTLPNYIWKPTQGNSLLLRS